MPVAAVILFVAGGCVTESGSYQDAKVYPKALYGEVVQRSFRYEGPGRNPVIVIHGFLGAQLVDDHDGELVWGRFSLGEMLRGSNYRKLTHPMKFGVPLRELQSDVKPTALLEKSEIQFLGFQISMDNYDVLVNSLAAAGYVPDTRLLPQDKHFYSQFIFYYDWRRDIAENAAKLAGFIQEKRQYLQRQYLELYGLSDYDVHFDLIGHSMGGLVARYYLRYGAEPLPEDEDAAFPLTWAGSRYVDKVVVIGTPNAGYVDTLIEMTAGLRLVSGAPAYEPAVVGSFVSAYQMLPDAGRGHVVWSDNGEEVDYFHPEVWETLNWGLASPAEDSWLARILPETESAEERRKIALDHLRKCLKQARIFKRVMLEYGDPPENVAVYLIAGDAVETNHTLGVDRKNGKIEVLRREAGDGKVTAASARLDLRDGGEWVPFAVSPIDWTGVFYLQGGHMGIMNGDAFASNLRYVLLAWPTAYQRSHREEYLELMTHGTGN